VNKRQKKKLYKKLHGYNQQKIADAQRNVQPKVPAPKQQLNHEALLKYQRPWDKVRPLEDSDFAQRISDALKRGAATISESMSSWTKETAKMFAAFSLVPDMINEARQQAERWATLERYRELLNIPEPPVVKTAKILTVQRLAGKRNKNHTRNRRKRKWH
jgi:hypothetical protein